MTAKNARVRCQICSNGYTIYPFKRDWTKCPGCCIQAEENIPYDVKQQVRQEILDEKINRALKGKSL